MNHKGKVIITGGGAAGMAAAVFLAEAGCEVHLYEKNEKLGKKLYITGKGRCNFTNACEEADFLGHIVTNARFLHSAFAGFTNHDAIRFFESLGMKTKVERGNRAFPVSDHASDVIRALERRMRELKVRIHLNTPVLALLTEPCVQEEAGKKKPSLRVRGVSLPDGEVAYGDAVIVATGGLSYPSTGSTGDGYRFAAACGIPVTPRRPSLVPLLTQEAYIPALQGLSLKNVTLTVRYGKKGRQCFSDFGEMLFTHEGISGPLVLSASAHVGAWLSGGPLDAYIDLKPALTEEQLHARILREFEAGRNKAVRNVISTLLPAKLRPVVLELAKLPPEKPVHDVTKQERQRLVDVIRHFPLTVRAAGSYREAVITQGGVSVRAIDPKTMQAKQAAGLYFVGEVLDVDGLTGGFNLQIAWSTAHAAAAAVAAIAGEKDISGQIC